MHHSRSLLLTVIGLATALYPTIAHADGAREPQLLTPSRVVERTIATHFGLESARQGVREAEALRDQARRQHIPQLTTVSRYTRLSPASAQSLGSVVVAPEGGAGPVAADTNLVRAPLDFAMPNNRFYHGASLSVPVSDHVLRYPHERRAAEQGARAARHELESAKSSVAADAATAFYEWARARLRLTVAEQSEAQARAHLHDAEVREAAGSATRADALRIASDLSRVELQRRHEAERVAIAEDRLRTLMHDPDSATYTLNDGFEDGVPDETRDLAQLLIEAKERRPDLRAQRARARALREQADATRSRLLPRLDVSANVQYENPSSRRFPPRDAYAWTWDAGMQSTWALSEIPAIIASARATRARADAVEAARAQREDDLRLEIVEARSALAESLAALTTSEQGLRAAEESYRVRKVQFEQGSASTVEVLDAETELSRARLAAIDARIDGRLAHVALDRALGNGQ